MTRKEPHTTTVVICHTGTDLPGLSITPEKDAVDVEVTPELHLLIPAESLPHWITMLQGIDEKMVALAAK